MKTPFLGAAYRARSKNLSDQLCINLYPEVSQTKTAKSVAAFIATPGLDLLFDVGTGPIRAMHVMAGILYVVSGAGVYSVNSSYVTTLIGTMPTSTGPCEMIDNGKQLLIVDGNVWQTVTDVTITAAGSGGHDGTYPIPIPPPAAGGVQATGVFTITGGVISDATIIFGGSNYSGDINIVDSSLAAVPGVGPLSGASLLLSISGGVAFAVAEQFSVLSVLVASTGGQTNANYAPNDVITLSGGAFTQAAQIRVDRTQVTATGQDTGGGVTGTSVLTGGAGFPVNFEQGNVPCTGGHGTGALFKVKSVFGGGAFGTKCTFPGTGYEAGDVLFPAPTDFGTGLSVTVLSVNGAGIVNGGAGGTPGSVVLTGTTGVGTLFQINGVINSAGVLASLGSIVNFGSYTANPTDTNNEPVTGGGLTGAIVSIAMGAQSATVILGGEYSKQVAVMGQQSTTGQGAGATWTPTYSAITGTLSFITVSLPFPGASTCCYQDGFGLINQLGTNTFWQSDLLDLTMWDPLNFSEADADPDNVIALGDTLREVWVVKEKHAEIWIDAGLAGFSFQRLDGVYIEYGTIAPASLAQHVDSMFWLGQDGNGVNQVLMSQGYKMEIISTPALQYAIEQYPRVDDAFAFCYQQEGHSFYFLTFPSGNATWVYDINESRMMGAPMWHQRAAFLNGQLNRHWASCTQLFNGLNLVGDYRNGNVYAFNLDTQTDNGSIKKWVRSWRALPQPSTDPVEFNSLQMDMQTGIGVPDGTNPQVVLEWSDDGGHNWSDPRIKSAGKTGETALRVKFNRLGSTRLNSGLDRIFKVSSTDPFAVTLIGADINV